MDALEKKLKRRVPDSKRQRVSVSCDRCKLRRIRCIRLRPNDEPCAACEQLGITCQSTLPRKERVYTADYDLQNRHQALVALVQGCAQENVSRVLAISRRWPGNKGSNCPKLQRKPQILKLQLYHLVVSSPIWTTLTYSSRSM
jgi:hypothetical protein